MTEPGRKTAIETSFDSDRYAEAQGFSLSATTDESVTVTMVVRDDHLNFHDVLHGGALFSLADCAFSLASNAHGDTAMAIDTETRRPVLANGTGGLSGPAIRPLAVWLTWQVHQAVDLPLIGMGGIVTARDALEFILAGASAVQVGTANFIHPDAATRVLDGLEDYLVRHEIASIRELVGTLASGVTV